MRSELTLEPDEGVAQDRVLTLGHVGMGTGEVEPFDQIYGKGLEVTPRDIEQGAPIDALVIWGGEDISPSLYKSEVSRYTWASSELSRRDWVESSAIQEAIKRDIPIIGVCRGAQLVCAMAGGRLIQHVDNHGTSHYITTFDGKKVVSSSVHHQMMYPFDVEHELLAWAEKPRSRGVYIIGDNSSDPSMEAKDEPEIVWFPKIKALGIQGHPEFHSDPDNDPFVQYCMDLVRAYIL